MWVVPQNRDFRANLRRFLPFLWGSCPISKYRLTDFGGVVNPPAKNWRIRAKVGFMQHSLEGIGIGQGQVGHLLGGARLSHRNFLKNGEMALWDREC